MVNTAAHGDGVADRDQKSCGAPARGSESGFDIGDKAPCGRLSLCELGHRECEEGDSHACGGIVSGAATPAVTAITPKAK